MAQCLAVACAIVAIGSCGQGWAESGKFTKPPQKIKSMWAMQANSKWAHQQAKGPWISSQIRVSRVKVPSGQPLDKIHHSSEDAEGTAKSCGDDVYQDAAESKLLGVHPGKIVDVNCPIGNIRLERTGVG